MIRATYPARIDADRVARHRSQQGRDWRRAHAVGCECFGGPQRAPTAADAEEVVLSGVLSGSGLFGDVALT